MKDFSVNYLGLKLKNPIVVGSSGLTNSIEDLKKLEAAGAGAVVLKSLFEEEIIAELHRTMAESQRPSTIYPEIFDFFDFSDSEDTVSKYLFLIEQAKRELSIPVIASVNCVTADEWPIFAKRIQAAGADALELNVFVLPSDFSRSGVQNEKIYFDVIEKVQKEVTIPISLKVSYYFSNLAQMLQKLSETGIAGLTLFNRFFSPNIDIDSMKVVPSNIYSKASEITMPLRWIGIMADRVKCDLAASTGVHDGDALIKQLLAGADVVHIATVLYRDGFSAIGAMLKKLDEWMEENGYSTVSDFKGKLSQSKVKDPAAYERAQFMKHFSGKVSEKI